jgi:hypothetical protein
MSTWTTISNAAVAVGAIPSSSTVTALRDNPVAIAGAASGSPVVFAGWHPVDKVTIGDGKDGLIYDHAVTGNVGSVVTPDFEDGYEYRVIAREMRHSLATNQRLTLDAFFATAGSYRRLVQSADDTSVAFFGFDIEMCTPRLVTRAHLVRATTYKNGSIRTGSDQDSDSYITTAQKLTRARVQFNSGNITAGKIWMLRRREYVTSP